MNDNAHRLLTYQWLRDRRYCRMATPRRKRHPWLSYAAQFIGLVSLLALLYASVVIVFALGGAA